MAIAVVVIFIVIGIPAIFVSFFGEANKSSEPINDRQNSSVWLEVSARAQPVKTQLFMYDHNSNNLIEIDIEDYVIGVVAAEMPASFHIEALKAQAVAARTFAVYNMRSLAGDGCENYPEADVCSLFAHCQAWIDTARMKEKWGNDFEMYFEKVSDAVESTRGQIMVYRDQPIEVLFHSTSNGFTEDAGEVFLRSLPYYQVVESRGEENSSRFRDTVVVGFEEFIEIFNRSYPRSGLTAKNIASSLRILSRTGGGRVDRLRVARIELDGTDFRRLFGLDSADFNFRFEDGNVLINTVGFGHGVGMSQVGANYMALNGYDHIEILKHYYVGVEIEKNRSE